MRTITLTVNAKSVTATVEPRMHLADFLRETLLLTGTHLGCEHGVCGACTLLVDGAPVRSCITYAAACEGADITTIEGLDDDEIAARLRWAFSHEHGLQCGYCTPGMLISARDVVLRMPQAEERDIRVAMSGNLCRCTGYAGIVRAISRVLEERRQGAAASPTNPRSALGPAGSGHAAPFAAAHAAHPTHEPEGRSARPDRRPLPGGVRNDALGASQTMLRESFTVDYPRERVWAYFARLGEVATCLPGTSVLGTPTEDRVEIRMRVRAGPIVAVFEGAADVARDAAAYTGIIRGAAHDTRSRSATRGEIRYILREEKAGAATRVDMELAFVLTGPLAQFSRSALLRDIARRMTAAFAHNLQARLAGELDAMHARTPSAAAELNAGSLFVSALWSRIKAFVLALVRR